MSGKFLFVLALAATVQLSLGASVRREFNELSESNERAMPKNDLDVGEFRSTSFRTRILLNILTPDASSFIINC